MGTRSGGWAVPSCRQEALAAPGSQNAWSLEHPWLVSEMLKNTVFTDRETEAQPGKPGASEALQFCLAGPKWLGGWAGHSGPSAEAATPQGLELGGLVPEPPGPAHLRGPDFPPASELQNEMGREVRHPARPRGWV